MTYSTIEIYWFKNVRVKTGGSIFLFIWLTATMIIYESYVGNLRAALLAATYEKPLNTFQG